MPFGVTAIKVGYPRCRPTGRISEPKAAHWPPSGSSPTGPRRHGISGTNRAQPGLREALAVCHAATPCSSPKLDRLSPASSDARDIVDELTAHGAREAVQAQATSEAQLVAPVAGRDHSTLEFAEMPDVAGHWASMPMNANSSTVLLTSMC